VGGSAAGGHADRPGGLAADHDAVDALRVLLAALEAQAGVIVGEAVVRRARRVLVIETSGSAVTSISPRAPSEGSSSPSSSCSEVGLRTATAQVETPRIITPSSTA